MADDRSPQDGPLESREPSLEDLVELCGRLNSEQARYVVVGGFAVRAAGYNRRTMDIDLLIETGVDNEARVFRALMYLPDRAVEELTPGEVGDYVVVRVADEIVVDLMKAASSVDYAAAQNEIVVHTVDGVPIPFAAPTLLLRMKRFANRDKDQADIRFLQTLLNNQKG